METHLWLTRRLSDYLIFDLRRAPRNFASRAATAKKRGETSRREREREGNNEPMSGKGSLGGVKRWKDDKRA